METSYLKTLELDKIIARAAEGCVCKESREKLLALEPQCDPDEVRYALEQTDTINSLLIKNGSPRFGGVEGVSQLAARAVKGGVLSMGELLMVAGALRNFQNLVSWYGSSEHDALPTDDLFYALAPQPGLEQQISSAILAPDAMADTASHTLNDLRKKIRATENSIRDRLESMVRNMDTSKYLQESVVSIRNGRYVVPVKSEYRGEVSGIIHDVSSTGATVFVEPQAVVEANARILQYRAQEAQEIERILVAFTGQVAAIEPQFQYSYKANAGDRRPAGKGPPCAGYEGVQAHCPYRRLFLPHSGETSAHRCKKMCACRYFTGQGLRFAHHYRPQHRRQDCHTENGWSALCDLLHMTREGRQTLLDALLIADIGIYFFVNPQMGVVKGRNVKACLSHEGK